MKHDHKQATLLVLANTIDTLIESYNRSIRPEEDKFLSSDKRLHSIIYQFLAHDKELPPNILLNDRRATHFFDSNTELSDLNTYLRLNDCLSALELILTNAKIEKVKIQDLLEYGMDYSEGTKLKTHVNACIAQANRYLAEQAQPYVPITYSGDVVAANHLVTWQRPCKLVMTLTLDGEHVAVQLAEPKTNITHEQMGAFMKINSASPPSWYEQLPAWEKAFWSSLVKEPSKLGNMLTNLQPTLKRNYPCLANRYQHHLYLYNIPRKQLVELPPVSRSGVLVPFQFQDKVSSETDSVWHDIAFDNTLQLLASELPALIVKQLCRSSAGIIMNQRKPVIIIPILYQTALSEMRIDANSEAKMRAMKKQGIDTLSDVLSRLVANDATIQLLLLESNYPQNSPGQNALLSSSSGRADNAARVALVDAMITCVLSYLERHRDSNDSSSLCMRTMQLLLGYRIDDDMAVHVAINNTLAEFSNNITDMNLFNLLTLLAKYCELQLQKKLPDNKSQYYLDLATSEINLVRCLGGLAYLTCKSGKDRTAMVLQLADAELTTMQHPLNDRTAVANRRLAVQFFLNGHDQLLASASALGCTGLKSAADILPPLMTEMLRNEHCQAFKASDCYAQLNNAIDESDLLLPLNRSASLFQGALLTRQITAMEYRVLLEYEFKRHESFHRLFKVAKRYLPIKQTNHVDALLNTFENLISQFAIIGSKNLDSLKKMLIKLRACLEQWQSNDLDSEALELANLQATRLMQNCSLKAQTYFTNSKDLMNSEFKRYTSQLESECEEIASEKAQLSSLEKEIERQLQTVRANAMALGGLFQQAQSENSQFMAEHGESEAVKLIIEQAENTIQLILDAQDYTAADFDQLIKACIHAKRYIGALCALAIRKQDEALFNRIYPYIDTAHPFFHDKSLIALAAKYGKDTGIVTTAINCWAQSSQNLDTLSFLAESNDTHRIRHLINRYLLLDEVRPLFYGELLFKLGRSQVDEGLIQDILSAIQKNKKTASANLAFANLLLIYNPAKYVNFKLSAEADYAAEVELVQAKDHLDAKNVNRLLRNSNIDFSRKYAIFQSQNEQSMIMLLMQRQVEDSTDESVNDFYTTVKPKLIKYAARSIEGDLVESVRKFDVCSELLLHVIDDVDLADTDVKSKVIAPWLSAASENPKTASELLRSLFKLPSKIKLCCYIIAKMDWRIYHADPHSLTHTLHQQLLADDFEIIGSFLARVSIDSDACFSPFDLVFLERTLRNKKNMKEEYAQVKQQLDSIAVSGFNREIISAYRASGNEYDFSTYVKKHRNHLSDEQYVSVIRGCIYGGFTSTLDDLLENAPGTVLTIQNIKYCMNKYFYTINANGTEPQDFYPREIGILNTLISTFSKSSYKAHLYSYLKSKKGQIVLKYAIQFDKIEVAEALLQCCRDIEVPLDSATMLEYVQVHIEDEAKLTQHLTLLRKYGVDTTQSATLREAVVSHGHSAIFKTIRQSSRKPAQKVDSVSTTSEPARSRHN